MLKRLFFLFIIFLVQTTSLAGISPPPSRWQPEYTMNILILKDNTVDMDENFLEYAQARVSLLNSVLKRSRANVKAKLVGANTLDMAFYNIEDFAFNQSVRKMKEDKHAHIVFLFSELNFDTSQCGLGAVTKVNETAYSAGRYESFFCSSGDTFVHEVGHNLGLTHTSNEHSLAQYAAGHGTLFWVTVMAYHFYHGGLIRKQIFSNPEVQCDTFSQCGDTESADAVRFINQNVGRFIRNN
ncbi:hypothetical protein C1141_18770 [Vibrio agarivorans]|nr:hypothetical protein C1141_18770 [Vibrio agarivorans]